ncbi:Zinc finger CCCH domain-containing protein 62, partial [Cucurbita argyrosperma subsp. argyrosperma]
MPERGSKRRVIYLSSSSEEDEEESDDEEGESEEEFDNECSDNDCDELLSQRVIRFPKGDVCRGDTVLFTQKVYAKFDKVTRRGGLIGKRTVAGRVVKESYGASKQQHTFTVEVLWSRGVRKLPPLYPLLVKGRNLYKLRTFRRVSSLRT